MPLDALMEITAHVGELQRDFFNHAGARSRVGREAMTKFLEVQYSCTLHKCMETCWLPDTVAQKHGGPNISVEAQVYGQVFLGFWQVFLGFWQVFLGLSVGAARQ